MLTTLSTRVWCEVSDTFAKQTIRAFKANPNASLKDGKQSIKAWGLI